MLEYLLYSKRLRETIADLKAKGDFREEGLAAYNKSALSQLYIFCALLVISVFCVAYREGTIIICGLVLGLYLFFIFFIICIWKYAVVISTGQLIKARIVSLRYLWGSFPGWRLTYEYVGGDKAKYYKIIILTEKKEKFLTSNNISEFFVVYDQKEPSYSLALILTGAPKMCLSKTMYDKIVLSSLHEERGIK